MNMAENLAPNSKRVWSYTIDDLVVNMLFIAIFFEQLSLLAPLDIVEFIKTKYWVLIVLKIMYHTLFIWQNGKTLGKYIMKIKSVDMQTGEFLTLPVSFLRSCARVFNEHFFYIGFLPAFFTQARQAIHDRVSRSIVVND